MNRAGHHSAWCAGPGIDSVLLAKVGAKNFSK